jgi:hypothetical protein
MKTLKAGARFLVEEVGEGQRHLGLVAVVPVGDGVGDGHRARQGEFEPAPGMRAREPCLHGVHTALEAHRPHHLRHHRLVAVGADAHLDFVREVDALDAL